MVFFGISMYFVIHQATQNLNYDPVMQSHSSVNVCGHGTWFFLNVNCYNKINTCLCLL